ncbi:hypothetical protein G9F72_002440 [Clostridium estertheticum]|uniref:hypothetical protein n=1 Tax=Clostridium estertheticum TaxID=238834 RepID=UPI0013E95447|nr:hypothetical protein [Clostridium estertheticum]MBZ9685211.1 hypothetical protein [Clostridium estertheticum]
MLTEVDWANNVLVNYNNDYPHYLIQVVYKEDNPADNPYESGNGVIIIETNNLNNFMIELNEFHNKELTQYNLEISKTANFRAELVSASKCDFDRFIDDDVVRFNILDKFNMCRIETSSAFLTFLTS